MGGDRPVSRIGVVVMRLVTLCCLIAVTTCDIHIENALRCESLETTYDDVKNEYVYSDRDVLTCRENLAGGLACRDDRACNQKYADWYGDLATETIIDDTTGHEFKRIRCTQKQLARRIGSTCRSAPWYNGGWPLYLGDLTHEMNTGWQTSTCTNSTSYADTSGSSYKMCNRMDIVVEMNAYRYNIPAYQYRNTIWCSATSTSTDGSTFCSHWVGNGTRSNGCESGSTCVPDCSNPTYCDQTCHSGDDDDAGGYDCGYTPRGPSMALTVTGRCISVSDSGVCLESITEQYDNAARAFTKYDSFQCQTLSASGKYCSEWYLDSTSEKEFFSLNCYCSSTNDTSGYGLCEEERCFIAGLTYFYPSLAYCLVGIVPAWCMWYLLMTKFGLGIGELPYERNNWRAVFDRYLAQAEDVRGEHPLYPIYNTVLLFIVVEGGMLVASGLLGGLVNVLLSLLGAIVIPVLIIFYLEYVDPDKSRFGYLLDMILVTSCCFREVAFDRQDRRREHEAERERVRAEAEEKRQTMEATQAAFAQRQELVGALFTAVAEHDPEDVREVDLLRERSEEEDPANAFIHKM